MSHPSHLSPLLVQSSDVVVLRGKGCCVYDENDNEYLDFTSGIGVTATGHCHPHVVKAVQEQAERLFHGQYATVRHPAMLELADRLAARMPDPIDSICFSNAGAESVETAIRLARHATGRPNVICFQGGFHGRTMGAASVTTSAVKIRAGQQPMMGGVVIAPFPHHYRWGWTPEEATRFCLAELDHLFLTVTAPAETAAMIIEPVQGEYGYYPCPPGFLAGLRDRCDRHGILLIADEIQSGYGRSGRFWAHEHDGVTPDMVITAKGLASGMPLSALAAPRELMQRGYPGSQGGTYGANAVACAAALATLDVFEQEDLVRNAAKMGQRLRKSLESMHKDHAVIGDVRGRGLMLGMEIVDAEGAPDGTTAGKLLQEAERRHLLLLRCGPQGQVVRWLPALIVKEHEIDRALETFSEVLRAVAV